MTPQASATLAIATLHSLSTGLNSSVLGPLAGNVNQVVLGTSAPFECTSLPKLWYSANEARSLLIHGLHDCEPKSRRLQAYLNCRAVLEEEGVWWNNDAEIMAECFYGVDVPSAFNPRKIAQAGKSVKAAMKARLQWLKHDLLPLHQTLMDIFEPNRVPMGSGVNKLRPSSSGTITPFTAV